MIDILDSQVRQELVMDLNINDSLLHFCPWIRYIVVRENFLSLRLYSFELDDRWAAAKLREIVEGPYRYKHEANGDDTSN